MIKYDVVVVGAGPAGSTAARFSALNGAKTLLIEKKKDIGIPVQCGEFLPALPELEKMLTKVKALDELFNLNKHLIARNTEKVRIITPKMKQYDLDFKGLVIERRLFDKHLVVEAVKEGAEVLIGTKVIGSKNGNITTNKGVIKTKVIIAADGPHSGVARWVGLKPPSELLPCLEYEVPGDFGPIVEMYFGNIAPGGYAWVIPKEETANIGLGVQKKLTNIPLKKLLERFILQVCKKPIKPLFITGGLVPSGGPIPQTVKNNVLVVGDAAGHIMATNGGGIPIAMVCGRIAGRIAAEHVNSGRSLYDYETEWHNAVGTELKNAVQTKKLADLVFGHDRTLEFVMKIMGLRMMDRAVKCKPLLFNF